MNTTGLIGAVLIRVSKDSFMKCKCVAIVSLVSALLAGCGGGGVAGGAIAEVDKGVPAATSGGTTSGNASTSTLQLQLVDAQGNALASPTLSQTAERYLKVSVPGLQAFKRVEVKLDSALAQLTPVSGTQLSNASGIALFAIAPGTVTANGVVRATATVAADGGDSTKSIDLQVLAGSVALAAAAVSPSTATLGQAVTVSVNASVDGVAPRIGSLSVTFSSTCGSVSPTSAAVDATGKASAVIQTSSVGPCTVSASAAGLATPLSVGYMVTATPALGVNFVQVEPQVLYFKESVGPRTSFVHFKVFDAAGLPVVGRQVNASLLTPAEVADFCSGASRSAVTGNTGEVAFAICSGTRPGSVQVRATVEGTDLHTDSNLLTVQSGVPSQRFFDLVVSQLNFHVGGYFTDKYSGQSVSITAFVADRHGNPVPDGTPVTFVSEGGQINSGGLSSCVVRSGSCSVSLIGQEYRPLGASIGDPRPGRVTVLAMTDGEEHFTDRNNNGRFDDDELETVEQLGKPFLDKNESGAHDLSYDNLPRVAGTKDGETIYPMQSGAWGSDKCEGNANAGLSVANTCNKKWNGAGSPDGLTIVRRSAVVVFSGGDIAWPNAQKSGMCSHSYASGSYDDSTIPVDYRTELLACDSTGLSVRLADRNGNPLPADAGLTLAVRKTKSDGQCAATFSGGTAVIGNSTTPTTHVVKLTGCVAGDSIDLTLKTADGTRTSTFSVTLP